MRVLLAFVFAACSPRGGPPDPVPVEAELDSAPDTACATADWHADRDGDGFGDARSVVTACDAPAAFVADATDCDDAQAAVNPLALEACGTAWDDDCDGVANEPWAEGCGAFYLDGDADGFGDPGAPSCRCAQEAGEATEAGDCDDADAAIHPAAAEVCNDGVDNDCDGTGCAPAGGPLGDVRYAGTAAGDGAGRSLAALGDFNGDGFADLAVGAPDNDDGGSHAGAAYLVLGSAAPADRGLSIADARYTGEARRHDAGGAVAGAGDVDGDGFDDLLVGAYEADGAGAVYLLRGSVTPAGGSLLAADARYVGEAEGDQAGWSVSGAGDVDGDGLGDVIVGAPTNDAGGADGGCAWIVLGAASPGDLALASAAAQYAGGYRDEEDAGTRVAGAGDVDGDGLGDVLVGLHATTDARPYAGAAYLILGSAAPADRALSAADAVYSGERASDQAGAGVSAAGDVDGDGLGDLIIGAPFNDAAGDGAGAAYLVRGSASPRSLGLAAADARYTGEAASDNAGWAVAAAGDVNGDTFGDLLVGAPRHGEGGAAYVLFGGAAPMGLALSIADAKYTGQPGDGAGDAVSAAGDVNGDGVDDLLVGAPSGDAGVAYLVFGSGP